MKRIFLVIGIIVAFVVAAAVVVLATRQDVQRAAPESSIRITQSGTVIPEPPGAPSMTVVAHLPQTNGSLTLLPVQ